MAIKRLKHEIYQELRRKGINFKKNFFELSHDDIHELVVTAEKYNYKYNGAKGYARAFYDSMVRYYEKLGRR